MTYVIARSEEEINDLLNEAAESFDQTTSSYAEGAMDMARWLTNADADKPAFT